eukprot:SAG22_NODE_16233_length_330_cov_0.870130_1_plen_54_part_01
MAEAEALRDGGAGSTSTSTAEPAGTNAGDGGLLQIFSTKRCVTIFAPMVRYSKL